MPSDDPFGGLLDRESVLAGMPARRANTLLYLIESRTAHLLARAQLDPDPFATEGGARERELAFLEAFALGREPPLRPTIQDVERHASGWAYLIPENPGVRAAIAHRLGQKYAFTSRAVPGIRAALGLDTGAVGRAHQRLYGQALATIYAPRVTLADRARWAFAAVGGRLSSLPPFWLAFAFAVAVSLPAAVLALPIVVADAGPLAGLVLLGIFGVVNMLTMACMAEAVARNGTIRYGGAFAGRVVADYLGSAGSYVFTLAVGLVFFLALVASYLGLATTLSNFTGLPVVLWGALPFLVGLYLLSRPSLALTTSVSIGLGAINIGLVLLISLLALGHFQPANLLPSSGLLFHEGSFEPSAWESVMGVMLILYFGHVPLNQCAKSVLHRDPSGRSLIWGSVAGTACLTVLIGAWLVAISGAVAPQGLAGQTGTALVPLAAVLGPSAQVVGSALVVLLLGLSSLRCSTVLFNLARERLPARSHRPAVLPRLRGRLVFHPHGNRSEDARLVVTYLGPDGGEPRFRLDAHVGDRPYREVVGVSGRWEATGLIDRFPLLRKQGFQLAFDVLDANEQYTRLQVVSPMVLTYEGDWEAEMVAGSVQHRPATDARRDGHGSAHGVPKGRWRFWVCVSPVVLAFLLAEWLLLTGSGSFARLLGIGGVLCISVISGMFPVLLLAASRRTGEFVPGVVYRFLGHPALIVGIYLLFLANIFLHGLVIWQAPLERATAVLTGALVVGATIAMVRHGAFARRLVVELREDQRAGGRADFNVVAGGQPAVADVRLVYPDGERHLHATAGEVPRFTTLRGALFHLPDTRAQALKVWAYRISPSGDSEAMPAELHVQWGDRTQQFDLQSSGGQLLLPLTDQVRRLELRLPERSVAGGD
jgi:hypothetical protein